MQVLGRRTAAPRGMLQAAALGQFHVHNDLRARHANASIVATFYGHAINC